MKLPAGALRFEPDAEIGQKGALLKGLYWNIKRRILIFIRSPMAAMVEIKEEPP